MGLAVGDTVGDTVGLGLALGLGLMAAEGLTAADGALLTTGLGAGLGDTMAVAGHASAFDIMALGALATTLDSAAEADACIAGDVLSLYGYMGCEILPSSDGDTDAPSELGICTTIEGDAPGEMAGDWAGTNLYPMMSDGVLAATSSMAVLILGSTLASSAFV